MLNRNQLGWVFLSYISRPRIYLLGPLSFLFGAIFLLFAFRGMGTALSRPEVTEYSRELSIDFKLDSERKSRDWRHVIPSDTEALRIEGTNCPSGFWEYLASLGNLKSLSISQTVSGSQAGDGNWQQIQRLSRLESLTIDASLLEEKSKRRIFHDPGPLPSLEPLANLRELHAIGVPPAELVRIVRNHPRLTTLICEGTDDRPLTVEDFGHFSQLGQVRILDLSRISPSIRRGESLLPLLKLPGLRLLYVDEGNFDPSERKSRLSFRQGPSVVYSGTRSGKFDKYPLIESLIPCIYLAIPLVLLGSQVWTNSLYLWSWILPGHAKAQSFVVTVLALLYISGFYVLVLLSGIGWLPALSMIMLVSGFFFGVPRIAKAPSLKRTRWGRFLWNLVFWNLFFWFYLFRIITDNQFLHIPVPVPVRFLQSIEITFVRLLNGDEILLSLGFIAVGFVLLRNAIRGSTDLYRKSLDCGIAEPTRQISSLLDAEQVDNFQFEDQLLIASFFRQRQIRRLEAGYARKTSDVASLFALFRTACGASISIYRRPVMIVAGFFFWSRLLFGPLEHSPSISVFYFLNSLLPYLNWVPFGCFVNLMADYGQYGAWLERDLLRKPFSRLQLNSALFRSSLLDSGMVTLVAIPPLLAIHRPDFGSIGMISMVGMGLKLFSFSLISAGLLLYCAVSLQNRKLSYHLDVNVPSLMYSLLHLACLVWPVLSFGFVVDGSDFGFDILAGFVGCALFALDFHYLRELELA